MLLPTAFADMITFNQTLSGHEVIGGDYSKIYLDMEQAHTPKEIETKEMVKEKYKNCKRCPQNQGDKMILTTPMILKNSWITLPDTTNNWNPIKIDLSNTEFMIEDKSKKFGMTIQKNNYFILIHNPAEDIVKVRFDFSSFEKEKFADSDKSKIMDLEYRIKKINS